MTGVPQNRFRAALVQMRSGRNVAANLADAVRHIRDAAGAGAQYVQTPENTLLMEIETAALFEKIDTEEQTGAIPVFAGLARELGIWLHIGSIAVRVGEAQAANRAFLFAPDGRITARYDKIHMFDVQLPTGETYRESAVYRPGSAAVLAALPWCTLGITTCYDLRFPEQFKALAAAGAEVLTVPSAFTRVTGEAHWHVLLRARAIENGCFVLAAAQGGRHESGRTTYGHSVVISPWGEVIAEAGAEPGVLTAEIDLAQVQEVRGRIPALAHSCPFTVHHAEAPAEQDTAA